MIKFVIFLLLDMNLAGPFLMIFDKPNVPEMMEVMNENQNIPLEVSIPKSLLGVVISNTKVKCNCGIDSTKGSEKYKHTTTIHIAYLYIQYPFTKKHEKTYQWSQQFL